MRYLKTTFTHDNKSFIATVKEFDHSPDITYQIELYELVNGEYKFVWLNLNNVYSLRDCATWIRYKLNAKNKRIKWIEINKEECHEIFDKSDYQDWSLLSER